MIDSLISYLILKYSYTNANVYDWKFLRPDEFFRGVLAAVDEAKFCLLRDVDELHLGAAEDLSEFKSRLIQENKNNHAIIFIILKNEEKKEKINKFLRLKMFSSRFYPVIVDKNRKFHYKKGSIPLGDLIFLRSLQGDIWGKDWEKNCQKTPQQIKEREDRLIEDQQNFSHLFKNFRPYTSWGIVAVNCIIWFVMWQKGLAADAEALSLWGAKVGPLIWQGEVWRLVTPMFLHTTFWHLFSNCLMLLIIASTLEALVGRWQILVIYFISGFYGNLISLKYSPHFSVGASSAIFGLFGAFICYAVVNRKKLPGNFFRVAMLYLLPLFIYNLLPGLWLNDVDNFAHIGGVIGGVLSIFMIRVKFPSGGKKGIIEWKNGIVVLSLVLLTFTISMKPFDRAYAVYYYHRGNQAVKKNEWVQAAFCYNRSLDFEPHYRKSADALGKVYFNQAYQFIRQDREIDALKSIKLALKYLNLNENNLDLLLFCYEQMGNIYAKDESFAAALKSYKKALVFRPASDILKEKISDQYSKIAAVEIEQGKYDEAENSVRHAIRYDAKNQQAGILLGRIYYLRGDVEKASSIWKKAIDMKAGGNREKDYLNGEKTP